MFNILVLLEFKFAEVSTTLKMMQAISLKQIESVVFTKILNNKQRLSFENHQHS